MTSSTELSIADLEYAAQIVDRSSLAAFAFLVWEICITFTDEVEYIWSKPHRSPTKWAFLLARYHALFVCFCIQASGAGHGYGTGIFLPPNCHAWYIFQALSLQLIIICQQFIMGMRVYALYDQSRLLALTLSSFFIAENVAMAISDALSIGRIKFNNICTSLYVPHSVSGVGAAPVAYDLILLCLTLYKCIPAIYAGWGRTPLVKLLLRDGILAFLAVFTTFAMNGMFYLIINGPMNSTCWAWQFAISAVAPGRVLLRLHMDPADPDSTAREKGDVEDGVMLTTFVRDEVEALDRDQE